MVGSSNPTLDSKDLIEHQLKCKALPQFSWQYLYGFNLEHHHLGFLSWISSVFLNVENVKEIKDHLCKRMCKHFWRKYCYVTGEHKYLAQIIGKLYHIPGKYIHYPKSIPKYNAILILKSLLFGTLQNNIKSPSNLNKYPRKKTVTVIRKSKIHHIVKQTINLQQLKELWTH